ncbi:hypothetical protein APHAL10511_006085 [Amanita phalloides]|nr:hypothetical protein APHAL10511_006085 [Amanita phalloides]
MSRAPYLARQRSTSAAHNDPSGPTPLSAQTQSTRPLQITRPSTPGASPRHIPTTSQLGPSRPQRSELRNRHLEHGPERVSSPSRRPTRDNSSVTLFEASTVQSNGTPPTSIAHSMAQRSPSISMKTDDRTSPAALSAISAFQSAGSRRRAMTNDDNDNDVEYDKSRKQEIVEEERRRQQRIRERAPGRKATGRTGAGDIDAVLDQVKDDWEFVVDPDFNCVDLALQLLDESSHGKDIESFRYTRDLLSNALKGSVDRYYQTFASSFPHHTSLVNHLTTVQSQVFGARSALLETKDALGSKRADLVQLWSRSHTLDEMIRLLDQIEYLKSIPELLETLISEKRLLQASVLLVKSMKLVNKPDMLDIGAVSDLRSYLNGQDMALRDILVDELQSHLYLKSFWCESRWSAYVPNQKSFTTTDYSDPDFESAYALTPLDPEVHHGKLKKFLNDLSMKPNDPPHDLREPDFRSGGTGLVSALSVTTISMASSSNVVNPEADSFAYMETLAESLAVLGKLGTALDAISQRLSGEIFALVETTLNEVEERAEFGRRASMFAGRFTSSEQLYVLTNGEPLNELDHGTLHNRPLVDSSCLRLAALELSAKQADHEILRDLFWTLYSKLDAVVQGYRVVSEVANRVGSRRDFKDSSGIRPGTVFPLDEVWYPIQAEVHNLIRDYLVDEEQGSSSGRHPILSINEVLREGRLIRDKNKTVFRLADTDVKLISKILRPYEDDLTRVLKDTMPGLVPGSSDVVHASISSGSNDERLGLDQHHRLLIHPDAFHISVLFQPTLSFLDQIADLLPDGVETALSFSGILNDFVVKVYLPQLEDKVSDLFHHAVTGPDAFEPDPISLRFSKEPLTQSSTKSMALVNSLCDLLSTSPFHRESYSPLILSVIIQFYQRCSDRFQDLVSVHKEDDSVLDPILAISAQWSQKSEITSCLAELLTTDDVVKQEQLSLQETEIELGLLGQGNLSPSQLMFTIRQIPALAVLHRSVSWFNSELQALRSDSDMVQTSTDIEPTSATTPYRPHFQVLTSRPSKLQLPLSREMALRYQALLRTYEQLSNLILDTIRIEIRCRTMFYIDSAMRHGNYTLEGDAGEPDPYIVDLNRELAQCDDFLEKYLPEKQRRYVVEQICQMMMQSDVDSYVFVGLSYFMEQLIIRDARLLRLPNAHGIRKVLRNILALQQSAKTWTNQQKSHIFEHAKQYYSLFFISPQAMLDGIRQKQNFSFDEYQAMLDLQCGVVPTSESGVQKATDRNYSVYVIDLHGLEMEKTGG